MADFQLLFLDIDGTILKPDHTYDMSTKEAILQVQQQGIEVFLATGRPLHEVGKIAEELNIHSFIGYNGALAIYRDQPVVNEPIDQEIIINYLKIARNHGHELVLYTSDTNYFSTLESPAVDHFIDMFQLKQNELFTMDVADQILGITLIGLSEQDPALYEIHDSYHFSQVNVDGLRDCYDVIRSHVNKGSAVQAVTSLLHIPLDQVIAFGDGMNDKEMLHIVGESFAMGNANPHLFAYAKHKTTTVNDNGIFNGLKSLGLVK